MSHVRNCNFTTSVEIITLMGGGLKLCQLKVIQNYIILWNFYLLSYPLNKKENILCLFSDTRMVFLVFKPKIIAELWIVSSFFKVVGVGGRGIFLKTPRYICYTDRAGLSRIRPQHYNCPHQRRKEMKNYRA